MAERKTKLLIIVASTRPGRVGLPVATWFGTLAADDPDFEVELVDLALLGLPFMDEPNHPRLRRYVHRHTIAWSARIDAADAFVFVFPEYNHGFNAPLKNALDYLCHEWRHKPAGLVSYGGVSAGTRAAQMLKQVLTALRIHVVGDAVAIPFVAQRLDDGRRFHADEALERAAQSMLAELGRLETVLRPLREARSAG